MEISNGKVVLSEDDLKEIFELFSSPTKSEIKNIYDKKGEHYFIKTDINEEYSLTQNKKEYALDTWRAIIYFLYLRGYSLEKDGKRIGLSFIEEKFL